MNKIGHAGPGRPREFDLTKAIEDALIVFSAHGYAATSLPDLLAGTGLSRGSLYKAFGDKHALFLAALELYSERGITRLKEDLSQPSSLQALRCALLRYAQLSTGIAGMTGCPVISAATECLPADERVAALVSSMFNRMKGLLILTLRRGQETGEIQREVKAELQGHYLLCLIEGMRVVGKTGSAELEMSAVVEIALSKLITGQT